MKQITQSKEEEIEFLLEKIAIIKDQGYAVNEQLRDANNSRDTLKSIIGDYSHDYKAVEKMQVEIDCGGIRIQWMEKTAHELSMKQAKYMDKISWVQFNG